MTKNDYFQTNHRSINTKVHHSKILPLHTEVPSDRLHNPSSNHELPFNNFPIPPRKLFTIHSTSTRAEQKNNKQTTTTPPPPPTTTTTKAICLETVVLSKIYSTNLTITIPNSSTINSNKSQIILSKIDYPPTNPQFINTTIDNSKIFPLFEEIYSEILRNYLKHKLPISATTTIRKIMYKNLNPK